MPDALKKAVRGYVLLLTYPPAAGGTHTVRARLRRDFGEAEVEAELDRQLAEIDARKAERDREYVARWYAKQAL